MIELLPFFLILFVGVFFSEIFSRLHLPWVIALIVGGIVVGPDALGIFEPSAIIHGSDWFDILDVYGGTGDQAY